MVTDPDPIARSSETHRLCAVAGWVQFSDNSPDDRSPRHGVAGDEEAGECDHGGASFGCVFGVVLVQGEVADTGKDHETAEHPQAARDQRASPAETLNNKRSGDSHEEVDATENHRSLEGVVQTGCGEDGRAVVEKEVGTGQLLQRLHADTEQSAVHHARTGEDFVPGVFSTTGVLGVQLGFDLADFTVDFPVVFRHAVRLCDGGTRALDLSLAVLPAGRLAEEHDADRHDD
jgi:hypothetical protein